jgi:hypothetical protein
MKKKSKQPKQSELPSELPTELPTEQTRLVNRLLAYVNMDDNSLDFLQAQRRQAEILAGQEMDRMADELAVKEAERKRLWGNKFPRVLGQKPDEPINPVKSSQKQGVRKSGKRATRPLRGGGVLP